MPAASHPQAKFDPIPPNLKLDELVEDTPNFQWAPRISAEKLHRLGAQKFEKLILLHVINGGKPLVIEKLNERLPKSLFGAGWLEENHNKKEETVRDLGAQANMRMTVGHYVRSMKQLTEQWTPTNFRDERRQRLYLKDIDCPTEWHDRLQRILPANLFYMNENVDQRTNKIDEDGFANRSVAPAGDLMSCLPEPMRAQNMMCYIGHEGTYTPAHREMCASLGQNIMVDASGSENGEKPGSSIWFMTETKDREVVAEYFLSMLGHDIEIEKHFAQINAWKKATFPVYVVEQKLGDFILVPPLAPHQVWNRGTRTMKVAWNRTTVETLEMAMHEALPKARLVCRDEQYKNKAIVYFALQKYYRDLNQEENSFGDQDEEPTDRVKQLRRDFKKLFSLFTEIMVDEMFGSKENDVELIEFDSNITCSYCRANIFNRFLTCKNCVRLLIDGEEDTYDICMECYVMGRSCLCVSNLSWCEQWDWTELVNNYETWRSMIINYDGFVDIHNSPLPLEAARRRVGKKSVAHICQEQLKRRPFTDINKPDKQMPLEPEDQELDADGLPVKKKKKGRKAADPNSYRCHVCQHKHANYRLAFCTSHGCNEAYCYGTLWRAFDLLPQEVMKMDRWKCPKCLKICNCGGCRKSTVCVPYRPKSTMLGHDTKKISDDRSRENLVDFRVHNLTWLKALGEESRSQDTSRMHKLKEQANAAKASTGRDKDTAGSAMANGESDVAPAVQPLNGHGDQDGLAGPESAAHLAGESSRNGELEAGAAAPSGTAADPSDAQEPEEAADSAYPDPSDVAQRQRMPGLAYYQQDDSPDKILFDEYEIPSADLLDWDEDEELDQKKFRGKRKWRMEEEDPEYPAPRSHNRKRNKNAESSQAMVDPALLDEGNGEGSAQNPVGVDGSGQAAPAAGGLTLPRAAESSADGAALQPSSNGYVTAKGYHWYDANVPELRQMRQNVSYAEPEGDGEEFIEIVPPKEPALPSIENGEPAASANHDPLDLAADAIRALTGQSQPSPAAAHELRKRGRPGRPKGPLRTSERTAATIKPPENRPRQSRTSLLASQGLDRNLVADDSDSSDIEAQLEAELEAEAQRMEAQESRHQAGETAAAAATSTPATGPRKRGRPPKQRPTEASSTPDSAAKSNQQPGPSTNSEPKFLTMAERMALKGKKFKIGKSKSDASTPPAKGSASVSAQKPTTTTDSGLDRDTGGQAKNGLSVSLSRPGLSVSLSRPVPVRSADDGNDSSYDSPSQSSSAATRPQPSRPPAPKQPASAPAKPAPTVVRLMDSEEEGDDDFMDDYDDDDDDDDVDVDVDSGSSGTADRDDDTGIPARKAGTATRGRGGSSLRGRGRPRGGSARRGVGLR